MNHQPQLTDGFGGDVFIARQPIFDRNNQVFAYELLYRGGTAHNASNVQEGNETTRTKLDGDTATARVVLTAFVDMGIDKITGGKKAFLNFTKTFLNKTYLAALPRTKVVIELLENIEVTPEVVTAIRALKKAGYTIALDDFFYDSKYEPLLELADIVKVDITLMSLTELKQHVSQIKKHQQIKLLAEKVETQAEQKACMDMGFDYFQGYFFAKPNIIA
ncbi:MAG: EAL domain-containing protein, partial [Moraxella osloensis]|nr:EAL domain-containing protein [Moraxella osloensis]